MRIHLVFPALPPVLNGIGDYTACLAKALSFHAQIKVLTGQGAFDAIDGVAIEQVFSIQRPQDISMLPNAVVHDRPNWLILQYNPFSYGRWGLNPFLPLAIRRIKRCCPQTRIALMVHEPFVPIKSWKWAIETTWQRWQLWVLARAADLVFFSIDPWVRRFRRWFPKKPVLHLPVGSNIPYVRASRHRVRRQLGVDEDTLVVGIFGSAHPSHLLHFIRAATKAIAGGSEKLRVLYVGPHGARVRAALDGLPLTDTGPLPPKAVSEHFAAMDIFLAPFEDGVSSRRGSFMAGIQHGVATVSTYGAHTDEMLFTQNGGAFLLASDDEIERFTQYTLQLARDAERRARVGQAGRAFYEAHFSWERIASTLLETMEAYDARIGSI